MTHVEHWLPTRLVELTSDPLGLPKDSTFPRGIQCIQIRPRLRLASELERSTQYMTLSHCWGNLSFMTLTQDNLTELRSQIPVADLTKTFRESMEATVRMGIRYLWIDSLCIIQDDEDDWQRESTTMGTVYEHAFCNIAAAKAFNGDEGLFTHRSQFDVKPCVFMNEKAALWIRADEAIPKTETGGPLYTRAWVTQEYIMSHRILHFGRYQSYWQCLESNTCEMDYHAQLNGELKTSLVQKDSPPQAHNLIESLDYTIWRKVVERYTAGSLTYPAKDKLIAISAIAKKLCTEDTYLAGLWQNKLPQQLMWSTMPNDGHVYKYSVSAATRADPWRAPS